MARLILVLIAAFAGFWLGKNPSSLHKKTAPVVQVHPEKEYPLSEHKSFVVVIYGSNQSLWCERALRSVFEQDYDHYRVIFVDDGSIDETKQKADQFILDNNQGERVILIHNEKPLGRVAALYCAMDHCLDREIILPIDAKDWLSHPYVLKRLNRIYQNPDVWITESQMIEYPTYHFKQAALTTFYAAIFKQIPLDRLYIKGSLAQQQDRYLTPIKELCGGRCRQMEEPTAFLNLAHPLNIQPDPIVSPESYPPLAQFPYSRIQEQKADIVIFSQDRPLQLYASLESIQRYITGFERLTVLYTATDSQYSDGYEQLKQAFPQVSFISVQSDFKKQVQAAVFHPSSQYVVLGDDTVLAKDFFDLKICMDQMEKTKAYAFHLHLGRHIERFTPPSLPLSSGVYAWDLSVGEGEWSQRTLTQTLFKKERLKAPFSQLKYKSAIELLQAWGQKDIPEQTLGLYFERSKLLTLPMMATVREEGSLPNAFTAKELLAKFNQGLKLDIDPLYKIENGSPQLEYLPEFTIR